MYKRWTAANSGTSSGQNLMLHFVDLRQTYMNSDGLVATYDTLTFSLSGCRWPVGTQPPQESAATHPGPAQENLP